MRKDIAGSGFMLRTLGHELNNISTGAGYLLGKLFPEFDKSPDIARLVKDNDATGVLDEFSQQSDVTDLLLTNVAGRELKRGSGGFPIGLTEDDEKLIRSMLLIMYRSGDIMRSMGVRMIELDGCDDLEGDDIDERNTNSRLLNAVVEIGEAIDGILRSKQGEKRVALSN